MSSRVSATAAETGRVEDVMRLDDTLTANSNILQDMGTQQQEANAQSRAIGEGLKALTEKADQFSKRGEHIQMELKKQHEAIRSIEEDISQIKQDLENADMTNGGPIVGCSADFGISTSALDITSKMFVMALSGALVTSARDMARQAREMSTISKQAVLDTFRNQ